MTDFYKNNDDQIRDKLTQHEFTPVSGAWENMSKLLDQQQTVPKAAGAWWWSLPLVAAAVLTGVISVGMYLNKNQALGEQVLAIHENDNKTDHLLTKEALKEKDSSLGNNLSENDMVVNNSNANLANENTTTNSAKENLLAHTTANTKERNKKAQVKKSKSNTTTVIVSATTNSNQNLNAENVDLDKIAADNQSIVEENDKDLDGSNNNVSTNKKVKTTKTIVSYQYSITPLLELQAKRKMLKEPEPNIGNFGISEEFNRPNCPVKIGVFAGASGKMYGSTKKISVMPTAGVTASYKIAPRHALQVGVQYKAMSQFPDNQNNENTSLTYQAGQNNYRAHSVTRIDMLEIPLVYKFFIHQKFNAQAGIKAAWVFNTETTHADFNNLSNNDLGVANFDFGMLFGLEYLINKHWSLGLQYSLGFINLTETAQTKQNQATEQDLLLGVDSQEKTNALSTSGEIIVPVTSDANNHEILRLPSNLHNNDIQLLLKYTF